MAIFNMTAGSSGIKVGHDKTLIKELKFRDYTLEDQNFETPIPRTRYPDFFAFTRNGIVYIISHNMLSANRVIYRYDPATETFTQATDMSLPPEGTSTDSSNGWMLAKHYLYDPNTDTVHFAADYLQDGNNNTYRAEYKFDFSTNTWTKLENTPLAVDQYGCDWTINSAGTIVAGRIQSGIAVAPYRLVGTTWTLLPASSCLYPRTIYNADDELCMIDGKTTTEGIKGFYIFDESTWTKLYSLEGYAGQGNNRVCSVDNEGNIAMMGRITDPSRTSPSGADFQAVFIYTKERHSRLKGLSYGGAGSTSDSDLLFNRAAITWVGNVGFIIFEGSNYLNLSKVKPVYELVES